jgi:hypothetical protein
MTRGLLSSMAALLAGTGLALGQAPAPMPAGPATAAQPPAPVVTEGGSPYGPAASLPALPDTMSFGGAGGLTTCGGGCGGGCGLEGCQHGDCSDPCHRIWVNTDYLLWRITNTSVPGLAFSQPLGTINIQQIVNNGTAGNNSTGGNIVINQQLPVLITSTASVAEPNFKDFPGWRISAGYWFDSEQCCGIDTSVFQLFRKSENFVNIPVQPGSQGNAANNAQGFPILIPTGIIDQIGVPSTQGTPTIITVPVNLLANINSQTVGSLTDQMWGAELNLRTRKCYFGCTTIDCFAGIRYIDFDEDLQTQEFLNLSGVQTATNPVIPPNNGVPTTLNTSFTGVINDTIQVQNRFYGAQAGANADICLGCGVFLDGWFKLGIGDMHEDMSLQGFTVTPSGILKGGSLVGPGDDNTHRTFDRICFVPELALNLGYQPCHWLRLYVGYTNMYISTLARATQQTVPTSTNATITINGTAVGSSVIAPAFQAHDTDMWVQGLNVGFELRW